MYPILRNISVLAVAFSTMMLNPFGYSNLKKQDSGMPVLLAADTAKQGAYVVVDRIFLDLLPPSTGIQFYKDGIIYLGTNENSSRVSPVHTSFGLKRTVFSSLQDNAPGVKQAFSATSDFPYPTDGMTFSNDFATLFYTRVPDNGKTEKIFRSRFFKGNGGEANWPIEKDPLPFCKDNFTYTHPALSYDGKVMIYCSDRSGTEGGMDLFASRLTGDSWSEPVNLGKTINSQGNEFSPFLDERNNLYFSSNGLPGKGGYDVFYCKYNGKGWDKPINLSYINTDKDEISFKTGRTADKIAFYTSRKPSMNGEMRLFRVTVPEKFVKQYQALADALVASGSQQLNFLAENTTEVPAPRVKKAIETEKKPAVKETRGGRKAAELEAERLRKEKRVADSLALVRVEQEKIRIARAKADSVENVRRLARLEEERLRKEKLRADSIAAAKKVTPPAKVTKDVVTYRIQFVANVAAKGSYKVTIAGKSYSTFEYLYAGAYRSCVGEFTSFAAASEFQKTVRQSGYPQAFVVAFKNNIRTTDPALFK
ncbi:MAG: hypothetical protein U0X39_04405 [Bacteroidales bacterium]